MLVILVVVAGMVGNVLPALSAEDDPAKQKDECLLITRECGYSAQSIQDKIERLKEEIAKGTTVYTADELRILKQKLYEVNKVLDLLGSKPPVEDRR
jgi:hypothetical protein